MGCLPTLTPHGCMQVVLEKKVVVALLVWLLLLLLVSLQMPTVKLAPLTNGLRATSPSCRLGAVFHPSCAFPSSAHDV